MERVVKGHSNVFNMSSDHLWEKNCYALTVVLIALTGHMTEKVVERRFVLKISSESPKSIVYSLRIQFFPLLLLCFRALRYSNSRFHFTGDN